MKYEYAEGVVHGRFQPLHNDHMEYILAAKAKAEYLWIGIAQYDVQNLEKSPEDTHREARSNNPLTYAERVEIIDEAMCDAGFGRGEYGFVPFPIESPNLIPDFVPRSVSCFTTIYDDWNRKKVERLRSLGYEVIVLWERTEKKVVGSTVRQCIRIGSDAWTSMVPPATARAVAGWNLRRRLADLYRDDEASASH